MPMIVAPSPNSLPTFSNSLKMIPANSTLLSALGAMGASEMCNRVTRVLTAVTLANTLSPSEFGLAAVALTTWELMRVFTATGLDARILQCTDTNLEKVCRSSYTLNWGLFLAVFVLQSASAYPIAHAYGDNRIVWLILGLAIPYLAFPWVAVQVYRLQRERNIGITAAMLALLISGDNLLTSVMALGGYGLWSIVVPKIVMSLIWTAVYLKLSTWRPTGSYDAASVMSTFRFSGLILATEIINVLRLHGDKLIVGQVLGLEQLGIYYFAFNSGLGILSGIVGAFGTALLPHFCRSSHEAWKPEQFWKPVFLIGLLTIPLVAVQAGLAPIYVPIVFGHRWNSAIPLMMILCISGITLGPWRSLTQFIRSRGRPGLELAVTLIYATAGLAAVAMSATVGLTAVALAILFTNVVAVPLLTLASIGQLYRAQRHARV
jgi:teichuronic acid exporter